MYLYIKIMKVWLQLTICALPEYLLLSIINIAVIGVKTIASLSAFFILNSTKAGLKSESERDYRL